MRSSLVLLTLVPVFLAGCSNLNDIFAPQSEEAPPPPKVEEAKAEVIVNPNYKEPPAFDLPAGDDVELLVFNKEETQSETAATMLPDYAATAEVDSCDLRVAGDIVDKTRLLCARLVNRLQVDSGAAYAAPTAIPAKYSDCVPDLSPLINQTLRENEGRSLIAIGDVSLLNQLQSAQTGSGEAAIPNLIRQCRAHDVPYLIASSIREVGGSPALTIRIVRVQDGVTLAQGMEKADPKTGL